MRRRLRHPMRHWWSLSLAATLLVVAEASASAAELVAPDQHALVVKVEGDKVLAAACPTVAGCDAMRGEQYDIPETADASRIATERIDLEGTKRVMLVSAPARAGFEGRWVLLLAATPKKSAPAVGKLLVGFVDRPQGQEGERKTRVLLRLPGRGGEVLVSGTQYENATVCGRPTAHKAEQLEHATLEWVHTPPRSLSESDVLDAPRLVATATGAGFELKHPPLLDALVASSSGRPGGPMGMTDGNLATRWAEERPGSSRGDFIVMSAAEDVPIRGFELAIRPTGDTPSGAGPRTFQLVTHDQIFTVAMPEDAWAATAGAGYRVDLPKAITTSCIAVVLDEPWSASDDQPVGIAELRAITAFDGMGPAALAAALDGNDGTATRALLDRGGDDATRATMTAYEKLGPIGRRRALEVVDGGGCELTVPFWIDRLMGKGVTGTFDPNDEPAARRAKDRLGLCRAAASDALEGAMRKERGNARVWAARELAALAPARAVAAIVGSLDDADPDVRRGLRRALSGAAASRRAKAVVARELDPSRFASRSLVARIDLLRSLGPEIAEAQGAGAALAQVSVGDASFRTRYLLLAPASELAAAADARAVDFVRRALSDTDPHLRAEAARRASRIEALSDALRAAIADREPRVRQAALEALAAGARPGRSEAQVLALLDKDPWTFVRLEAARALGSQSRTPASDQALMSALEDESTDVRRAVLRSLAKRKSHIAAQHIHDVAADPQEHQSVRIAAVSALGALCRKDAAPLLYKLALRAGFAQLPYDQPLGLAALAALGAIKPPDLAKQLAPLLGRDERVPRLVRLIAHDVLTRQGSCDSTA